MATDVHAQRSFRQAGRTTEGSVKRSRPEVTVRTAVSIPSRFPVDSSAGCARGEKTGFGVAALRFTTRKKPQPGPGAYHKDHSFLRDAAACGSVSKKGYCGGFVSKTCRFEDREIRRAASTPGPGQYSCGNPDNGSSNGLIPSSVKNSRVFMKPQYTGERTGSKSGDPQVPGPGEYDLEEKSVMKSRMAQKPTSSFRSSTLSDRGSYLGHSDTPSPGQYEPQQPSARRDRKGNLLKPAPSAAFTSAVKRDGTFSLPSKDNPGVGAYDVMAATLACKQDLRRRGSSAFTESNTDRWGNPVGKPSIAAANDTPGPGWYTSEEQAPSKAAVSSGVFKSNSRRGDRSPGCPGPAFYSPQVPGKKSFHLNASQCWS